MTSNYEAMDERFSINSMNNTPDFKESREIPLDTLYFHEPFNVNQKYKSLLTDFTKFTKICR